MNAYALAAMLIGGGLTAILVIVYAYGRVKAEEGKLAEQRRVAREAAKAIRRADKVLAEHRDPNDANKRLRDGNF